MKRHPKRWIVLACVALIVAVGGTSYAASTMTRNGTAGQVGAGTGSTQPAGNKGTTARAGQLVPAAPKPTPAETGVAGAK
jgi:hypothetical protein